MLRRALCSGHWPLAFADEPFSPVSLNMCFVVHASIEHWPVDILWHCLEDLHGAVGHGMVCVCFVDTLVTTGATWYMCWIVMCAPMVGLIAFGSAVVEWSLGPTVTALPRSRCQVRPWSWATGLTTPTCQCATAMKGIAGSGRPSLGSSRRGCPSARFSQCHRLISWVWTLARRSPE